MFDRFNLENGIISTGQIVQHPINLDCLPTDDVVLASIHPALHDEVKTYAKMLLEARRLRLSGKINEAVRLDHRLNVLYNFHIPSKLLW